MKKHKSKIIISSLIIAIILFAFCFWFGFYNHQDNELNDFNLLEVSVKNGLVYYEFDENAHAINYEIIITKNDETIVESVTKNKGYLKTIFNYQDQVSFKVIAYNSLKEKKYSNNQIDLLWDYPSFSDDNNIYITKDQTILVDGNLKSFNYKLVMEIEDNPILEFNLKDRITDLNYDLIKKYTGKVEAYIIYNNLKVAKKNFYVNTSAIENVTIKSPNKEHIASEDFIFSYEGGTNANNIILEIYEDDIKKDTINLTSNETKMNILDFDSEKIYKLVLIAESNEYDELSRKDEVSFKVDKKDETYPVYTNVDFRALKKGSKIELISNTANALIYYTLDSSIPSLTNGIIYQKPIVINEDTLLKAIAIKDNNISSIVTEFDIKISDKIPVVYLSPSNQYGNLGVSSVGYSNEKIMMNKVADVVEDNLKSAGIKVYRNNPNQDMMYWLNESNYVKSDLHVAIHSNGSIKHDTKGVEVYVNDESSPSYSAAQMIYNAIYELYPYKSPENGRGVLYAKEMMGEVNPLNIKMGLLIEIAYHDDIDDARWMVKNINSIGNAIAKAIKEYFEI